MGSTQEKAKKTVKIIFDTDGLIGSLSRIDLHYQTSQIILSQLQKSSAELIYPASVIAETVTLLQGRLNQPQLANALIQLLKNNSIMIEPVDNQVLHRAIFFIDVLKSKRNTLFDAIVAAIAEEHKADAIFSFDKFYKKNGFKLAGELSQITSTP
ncbi:type II toxin-antitoxin system VapC family toxin [Candidatus Roizmanbacteria bacterium]|nr:type II toxin-antitoxin system VapC family toxin [Candidatus Roizmanbacteria bacterium]